MKPENINTLHKILDDVVSNHSVKHQLDSFNNYINWVLNAVIRNESSIRLTYPSGYLLLVKLSRAHLINPTTSYVDDNGRITICDLLLCDARYTMLNYNDTVLTNVNIQRSSLKTKHKSVLLNVPMASHPVMVGSGACSRVEKIFPGEDQYYQGGYFIISGNARTLAIQVRHAYNAIHVFYKIKNDRLCFISEMSSMSFETGHNVLIHIHQPVMVSNQLYGKDAHKMYGHRHLFLSMPQRDSCNNIMISYVIAILLLQRDGMIKISTSPTALTVTPELINRLGSRWNTMLKRLIGNEKEFKPALDSMLDKMLIFVKTSETIQHKTDYLQNK